MLVGINGNVTAIRFKTQLTIFSHVKLPLKCSIMIILHYFGWTFTFYFRMPNRPAAVFYIQGGQLKNMMQYELDHPAYFATSLLPSDKTYRFE